MLNLGIICDNPIHKIGKRLYPTEWKFSFLQKRMDILTIHHPVKKCMTWCKK